MANIYQNCFSCGKNCINVEFCSEGASFDEDEDSGISVPRNLKVKIIANPDFWGFSGTLIEGWARFENGYYDFFDGYDEKHSATKTCGSITYGPFLNEQRPDVFYRSVRDPYFPSGVKHYGVDGNLDGVERGGAEVYLVDRSHGQIESVSADNPSCDTTSPPKVFKKTPENFGFGNKIHFYNDVFKNITGAWRNTQICGETITDDSILNECDGSGKLHIRRDNHYAERYEFGKIRKSGEPFYIPDGAVAGPYSGTYASGSIVRDTGVSNFVRIRMQYEGSVASGIKNGKTIGISNNDEYYSAVLFDVDHQPTYTDGYMVGTYGTGNITVLESGDWVLFNSYDPQTCRGGKAYGVDDDLKCLTDTPSYHIDFGRIFNNSKNKRQSSRQIENRKNYGITVTPQGSGARIDKSYPEVGNGGQISLEDGFPVFGRELPYYGPFYEVDACDTLTRRENFNTIINRNATCYSSKASVEIFPDCLTQYLSYQECETQATKYKINRLPRLGIVYRGCNYEDNCYFNESGLPLGGWTNGAPTGIDDLKNGLAGQEIYMFVNLGQAWGGEITRCPCACTDPPPGEQPPEVVEIPSPVSFPCLINFDLYPERYGCHDKRYQIDLYTRYVNSVFSFAQCDSFPSVPEACNIRQPYTTYGFMRNLCGKEDRDRHNVITNAFSNLLQAGTYRNTTPNVNIDEPMFWEFTNPGSNLIHWSSGTTNGFSESGLYPYWGLTDSNGRLVAPYFRSKINSFNCCQGDPSINFIDFDGSGTFFNDWPKDSVPFLVEIDHTDTCVGCATTEMEDENLVLTIESLSASFIHNQSNKYGYNHCKYKGTVLEPNYSCVSGYPNHYCAGNTDNYYQEFGVPNVGNTCECMNGFEVTLHPFRIESGTMPLGWVSNPNGNNRFVAITGCDDFTSVILNDDYFSQPAGGISVYASFILACENNLGLVKDPLYPFAFYEGNAIQNLWSCGNGCGHAYPGAQSDLRLKADFVVVSQDFKEAFESLMQYELDGGNLSSIMSDGPSPGPPVSNTDRNLILCPNERVFAYGCALTDQYGSGTFYPCADCSDDPKTPCDNCSGVTCECDIITAVDGVPRRRAPAHYNFNECACACSTPSLMREYLVDNSGNLNLDVTYEPSGCSGVVYWFSISGVDRGHTPIFINQFTYSRFGLAGPTVYSEPYCSIHTGPNALVSGIDYKFIQPSKDDDCGHLVPEECNLSNCEDTRANSAQCKEPIPYWESGVSVNRTACFPEIMIVNKIECLSSGYKLNVSREYHTHDRTWYVATPDGMGGVNCTPKQTGVYVVNSSCYNILFATPTDSVTPAWTSPCSTNPPSGEYVTQDFKFNTKPHGDNDTVWNYYNLFYKNGFPDSSVPGISSSGEYRASVDANCNNTPILSSGTIFPTGAFVDPAHRFGMDYVNSKHSCLQDITECGADFLCNKMFFPRRSYNSSTRVTAFGALALCTQNSEYKNPRWYSGYEDFDETPDVLRESLIGKFIDPCDGSHASLLYPVGMDDTTIIVDDYLPLMGVYHSGWKYNLDTKSCVVVGTGNCADAVLPPMHSNQTISAALNSPKTYDADKFDSMGYYLDRTVASGNSCLLDPFKIMVDVECCPDRIRRKDFSSDEPTYLTYFLNDVYSASCKGLVSPPPCICADSECDDNLLTEPTCIEYYVLTTSYNSGELPVCPCNVDSCDAYCSGLCPDGNTLTASTILSWPVISAEGLEFEGISLPVAGPSPISCPCGTTRLACDNPASNIYKITCGGQDVIAQRSGPFYLNSWVCGDTMYLSPKGTPDYSGCCEIPTTDTLCRALSVGFQIPLTGCHVLSSSNPDPNHNSLSGIWRTECGCDFSPPSESPCSTNSILKVIITEES